MVREDSFGATRTQLAMPRWTPMVRRLILLQSGLFLACFALYLAREDWLEALLLQLGLDPSRFDGSTWPPLWQLVTYGFLHSVTQITHILFNMLTLFFFGTQLEERFGSRAFLFHYMAAQLAGAALFLLTTWIFGIQPLLIGASGACYGIMFAVATLFPHRQVIFILFPMTLRTLALVLLGMTVFLGLLDLKHGASGGVSHATHLGGLAYGWWAARRGWLSFDPGAVLERRRAAREAERAVNESLRSEADAARMDQLLEKIHREGMAQLTPAEKDFLRRASQRRP
jgi:membrane associated rhomboid family serine protease